MDYIEPTKKKEIYSIQTPIHFIDPSFRSMHENGVYSSKK